MNLKLSLSRLTVVLAFLALGSCVVYQPVPMPMQQSRFDQSWAAASGAIYDQGLTITMQDRSTGVIRGERGDTSVTATLETLPDGGVQVKEERLPTLAEIEGRENLHDKPRWEQYNKITSGPIHKDSGHRIACRHLRGGEWKCNCDKLDGTDDVR